MKVNHVPGMKLPVNDPPICIDLFSGLGGWSEAFKDRGWKVVTVDFDPNFKPDIVADIMDLKSDMLPKSPEIILASPPCNCFSSASFSYHFFKNGRPKTYAVAHAIGLVAKAHILIEELEPAFWIIENPRGMLRRFLPKPVVTTYFCSWGDLAKKPTDLWGELPSMDWPSPTDWEPAPKGSRKGTQGKKTAAERAKIPYLLSEAVCNAVEIELGLSSGTR